MWGPENNPKVKLRETAVKGSPGFGVRAEGERVGGLAQTIECEGWEGAHRMSDLTPPHRQMERLTCPGSHSCSAENVQLQSPCPTF